MLRNYIAVALRNLVRYKIYSLINQFGLIVNWDWDGANVHDSVFQPLILEVQDQMIVLADKHFHSKENDPINLKVCVRGQWNVRMVVETVLSMLTTICHFKKLAHRVWEYFQTTLAFTMAAFNILVQWNGLKPDEDGFVHLSIADFNL